jgi:hypothetical protein
MYLTDLIKLIKHRYLEPTVAQIIMLDCTNNVNALIWWWPNFKNNNLTQYEEPKLTWHYDFNNPVSILRSRDSSDGTVTGYGQDGGGSNPGKGKTFSSSQRPHRLWCPRSLLSNAYRGLFPGGKVADAWSWPLTSNYCRGQEYVDLYIHSSIRLHGVVIN